MQTCRVPRIGRLSQRISAKAHEFVVLSLQLSCSTFVLTFQPHVLIFQALQFLQYQLPYPDPVSAVRVRHIICIMLQKIWIVVLLWHSHTGLVLDRITQRKILQHYPGSNPGTHPTIETGVSKGVVNNRPTRHAAGLDTIRRHDSIVLSACISIIGLYSMKRSKSSCIG